MFNDHHQMAFRLEDSEGLNRQQPHQQFMSSFQVNSPSFSSPTQISPSNTSFLQPQEVNITLFDNHDNVTNQPNPEKKVKKKKSVQSLPPLSTESTEAQLSPMACQHCRSLHKKCDRTLPNCLRCLQTNHLCFYPDKKRKKSESLDSLDSQHKSPTGSQPTIPHHEVPKKKKKQSSEHHNNNQMNSNPMINQIYNQMGGHMNNQMNQQSQMNINADNFSQNLQQLAQNMGLGLNTGHDMNDSNPLNPLSLGLLSSKISSLNTTTQLQLLNMAANALSGNSNSLNNLISNIPAGILSAFTGGSRSVPNVDSVTPLVSIQNSNGQFQHSVKPITAFVLDIYFHTYSFGFPLIPKERMIALLDLVLLKQQQQLSSSVEMQQHYSIQIKTFYERVAKQFWSSAVDMEKDLAVFFAVLAATLQCSGNFVYQQYKNCSNHLDLISSAGAAINLHQIGSQYESPLENTMGGSSVNGTDSPHDDLFIQDLKNKWFNNSKNIVGKYFDDLDSMSIPIALTFLVYYLVGEGDLQRARMYTNMVENLCQKVWSSMNCFGIGSRGFVNGSKPVVSTLSKISGSGGMASSIMYGLPALLVHRYLRPVEIFLAEFEEPTNSLKRKLQNIGNKIRIDLTFIEDWECIKNHELEELERLIKFLNKYIDLLFSTMMNKESMLYITSYLTFHDVVMDVYKRAQTKNVDSLLRFAADVIEITKIPLFTFLPTAFINTIMKAVQVRLAYGKPSENPNINLRDDMAALKLLSAKYPVISKLYGDTIREVETVLYLQSFSHSSLIRHILPEQSFNHTNTNTNTSNNTTEFDFDDNNFDILNFLNGEPSHGMSGMSFDDELIGEIFGFSNMDNESTTSNTSCESIFIDGEKLEIPSCVKSGSFLPILIKNLSKQKEVLLQNDPNKSETIKILRTQLIEELTQHVGSDENTKLLIQLFTKNYVHK